MNLSNIKKPRGANAQSKRVGRGTGSGLGTTSGRGNKGQRCRAGYSSKPFWEGGQMPLYRVLAKSGFTNIFKKEYQILNLDDLERLGLEKIDIAVLKEKGIAPKHAKRIKILGRGKLSKAVEVHVSKISKSAQAAIENAKGKVHLIPEVKFERKRKSK